MLRRQSHQNALAYANRKIEMKQSTLDDLDEMMTKPNLGEAHWEMLDEIVWNIVAQIERLRDNIEFVLQGNKDRDEDEAWSDKDAEAALYSRYRPVFQRPMSHS